MRILAVHNRYQLRGGEESVFEAETDLLASAGHDVETLEVRNSAIQGPVSRVVAALSTPYSFAGRAMVREALRRFRPDILHVHNFFPQLSPSLFDACLAEDVPAVWTLHNFRIACASGLLFRDGKACELCLGSSPIHGVLHRCYRGSLLGSAAVAGMIGYHHLAGTWRHKVARFIALSEFSCGKIEQAGVPRERIAVKPNFVKDDVPLPPRDRLRTGAVFVGRLSPEKGADVLIEAWRGLNVPLTIIGDGPQSQALREASAGQDAIRFTGPLGRAEVMQALVGADFIVVPSRWYENCPMVVIEALAAGTPVVAADTGALREIVEEGVNGRLFQPSDPVSLREVVATMLEDKSRLAAMRRGARTSYEARWTPAYNLARLTAIYEDVLAERRSPSVAPR